MMKTSEMALLAVAGFFFIIPSTSGVKCIICTGFASSASKLSRSGLTEEESKLILSPKPCDKYKKGDKSYVVDCDHISEEFPKEYGSTKWICGAIKDHGGSYCVPQDVFNKAGECGKTKDGHSSCFCDKDECNGSRSGKGLSNGLLLFLGGCLFLVWKLIGA